MVLFWVGTMKLLEQISTWVRKWERERDWIYVSEWEWKREGGDDCICVLKMGARDKDGERERENVYEWERGVDWEKEWE